MTRPGRKPGVPIAKTISPQARAIVRQLFRAQHAARLTDEALAHKAGWASTTMLRWRKAERMPSLGAFMDVAEVLGFEVALIPLSTSTPKPTILKGTYKCHEIRMKPLSQPLTPVSPSGMLSTLKSSLRGRGTRS
jgi:hypothetical protein